MTASKALLQDLEADCFASSEQRVLAAFVVTKCEPPPAPGSRVRRGLPKPTGKPRVLCLTAKRRRGKRGFKGTLHVCKLSQGRYQVRKSVRLKLLARVEAFVDSPGQQEYLELAFLQRGFTGGEARLAFEARDARVRLDLLGALYAFCRAHEGRTPQVVGIDAAELEAAGAAMAQLGGPSGRALQDGAGGAGSRGLLPQGGLRDDEAALALITEEEEPAGDAAGLWGQREDKQVQSLLEAVSVGAASMQELQERLQAELAALEDASVHEMLEGGAVTARLLGELGSTLGLLDDLEESLSIFDARLRHMREDIAAIEDRNNQLELHSRNNARLLASLEGLVGRLALADGAERALQARAVTGSSVPAMVEAAWELHARLQSLAPPADGAGAGAAGAAGTAGAAAAGAAAVAGGQEPGGAAGGGQDGRLPPAMAGMAAVSAQRQRLHALQRSFVDKASAYLQEEFGCMAEPVLQRLAAQQGAARLRPPDHAPLRRRAAELAPLLEVVGVLRPAATVAPREAYCAALNSLLRREVHGAASEARRMAAAADAGGAHEPDLLDRAAAADSASTLERLSAAPSRFPSVPSLDLSASYRIAPIHEGYQALLDAHMPVLAEEAAQLIALAFPRALQGPQQGGEAAAAATAGAGAGAGKAVRFAGGGGGGAAAAAAAAPPPPDVGGAEVQGALSSLLSGLEGELLGLIDGVKPQRALLCLPMLGATLEWKQRLGGRGPALRPLVALLAQCEARLAKALQAYFAERAAAVQRYDGRSSVPSVGGAAVKAQHVLPFVANFPSVAARIEQLLQPWPPEAAPPAAAAGAAGDGDGDDEQRTPGSMGGVAGAGAGRPQLRASPFGQASEVSSALYSTEEGEGGADDDDDISLMDADEYEQEADSQQAGPGGAGGAPPPAQHPATQQQQRRGRGPGPGEALRELVGAGYSSWLRAMGAAVEALGASDPKHGQRLRLENYAFWELGLQALPLDRAPVLAAFASQVAALRGQAMAGYIEQQVDYFKFTRVLEFSRKLDEAAAAVGPGEVHLQLGYQAGEVRALLAATTGGLDKKLGQVYARVRKHLAATSPYLVDQVWDRLEGICLERWGRMEQQLAACYPGLALRPPPAELRRWFEAARGAQ